MGGWTGSDDEASAAALDRAVALGCNFFDSAWADVEGRSERLLGDLLRRHPGQRLFTATKVPPKDRVWPGKGTTPGDSPQEPRGESDPVVVEATGLMAQPSRQAVLAAIGAPRTVAAQSADNTHVYGVTSSRN